MSPAKELRELLRKEKVISTIEEKVRSIKAPASFLDDSARPLVSASKWGYEILLDLIPQDFLIRHKQAILVINPPFFNERAWTKKKKMDPLGHIENQSLYHLINDKLLMKVLREGKFHSLDTNQYGSVSTSPLEVKLGGKGIYCTYGHEYTGYRESDTEPFNRVIFPSDALSWPNTFCLYVENSMMNMGVDCLDEVITYEEGSGLWHVAATELGYQNLINKNITNFSREDFADYLVAVFVNLMGNMVHPKEACYDADCSWDMDIVVNDTDRLVPQMVLVDEEPEYYADEVKGKFVEVPFVSQENVGEAIHRYKVELGLPQEYDCGDDKEQRKNFVLGVNKGVIPIERYAVYKESS